MTQSKKPLQKRTEVPRTSKVIEETQEEKHNQATRKEIMSSSGYETSSPKITVLQNKRLSKFTLSTESKSDESEVSPPSNF